MVRFPLGSWAVHSKSCQAKGVIRAIHEAFWLYNIVHWYTNIQMYINILKHVWHLYNTHMNYSHNYPTTPKKQILYFICYLFWAGILTICRKTKTFWLNIRRPSKVFTGNTNIFQHKYISADKIGMLLKCYDWNVMHSKFLAFWQFVTSIRM